MVDNKKEVILTGQWLTLDTRGDKLLVKEYPVELLLQTHQRNNNGTFQSHSLKQWRIIFSSRFLKVKVQDYPCVMEFKENYK